jgi:hypothetical protein
MNVPARRSCLLCDQSHEGRSGEKLEKMMNGSVHLIAMVSADPPGGLQAVTTIDFDASLGDHPKPAIGDHLKTGQR